LACVELENPLCATGQNATGKILVDSMTIKKPVRILFKTQIALFLDQGRHNGSYFGYWC
jgi:hypothetical protein